jgi:hypothetical protein
MASPILSLIPERYSDPKVLLLRDTSIYMPFEDPENFLLEILSPTVSRWISYQVNAGFSLTLNGSSLKMQSAKTSNELQSLPDGVYTLRMSVKPNFSTLVEFDHLRTVQVQRKYDEVLCNLYSTQCSITRKEFEEKRKQLLSILMDLKAAIAKVEICHEKAEGIDLYEKVKKDLKKFSDECGC